MAENVMNSLPESKYTDPTPTSSASFKPPRSKESMLKNKTQTPQAEGWFSTFSYIKTIFTGKSVKDNSAKKVFNDHKEAQIDKKSYNPKNDTKQREKKTENLNKVSSKQEEVLTSRGQHNPSLILTNSKQSALNKLRTDTDKKSFGFSHKEIDSPEKKKSEQEQQQTPSYTPLRFVDNRSTYLHAPDKKGTTSFRVTTGPTVNAKPMYSASSPAPIRIMSSKRFASPTRSRDKMSNRKKALSPRKMADNIISSQFRLRSKSTPDRSTFKARPVSLSASQKSLSLNPESQKVARISKSLFAENVHEVAHVKSYPNPSFLKPTILGEKPTSSEFTACKTARPTTRPFTPQKPAATKTSMIPRMMPSMSKYNPLSENLSKQSRTENAICYSQHGNKSTVGVVQQTSTSSPSSKTVRDSKYKIRPDKVSTAFKPLQQVPVSPTFPKPSLLFTKEMDPDINESESASFAYNQYRHSRITTELSQNETGLEIRPTLSPAGPIPFRFRTEPPTETTMLTENIHPTTYDTAKQNMIQPQTGFPSMSTVPILQPSIPQPYSQKLASLNLIPSPIIHLEGDNPPKRFGPSIISPTLCEGICISSSGRSESFFNAKAVNHVENNVKLISTQDLTSGSYNKIDDPSTMKSSKQAIDQVVVSNDAIEESLNLHEDCDRSNSASSCDDICKTSSNATNYPFEIDSFSDDIGVSLDLCTFPHPRKQIPLVPTSLKSENRTNKIDKMPNEPSVIEKKKCDRVIHFPSVTSQETLNPENGMKIRFFTDETESVDSLLYDGLGNQDIEPTSSKCSNFDKSNQETRKTDDNFETIKPIRSTPFDKKEMKKKGATKNVNHTPKNGSYSPDMKLRVHSEDNSRNYQYHSSKSPDGSRFLKALSNVHVPTIPDEPKVQTPSYVRTKKKNTPNRKPYDFSSKIATPSFEEPTFLDKKVELFSSPDDLKKTVVSAIGSAVETFTEMLKPVLSPRLYSPEKVKPLGNEKVKESSYSQSPQKPYKEPTQIVDKPLAATRTFIANFLEESGLSPLFRGEIGGTDKLESKTKTKKALTGRLAPTSLPTPPPSTSPVLFKANEKKASPSPTKIKQRSPVLGPTVLTESNKQKPNTARKTVIKLESSPTRSNDTVKQKEIQPGKNSAKKETKPDVSTTKVEKSQLQGKQLSENPNLKTSTKQSTIFPTGLPNTTTKSPEQKPDSTIVKKTQSSTIRKQVVRGKENALSAYYLDPSEYNSTLTQLGEIP